MTDIRLDNPRAVKLDRMRYTKNVFSSRLTYLAILFNVFYFVSIYGSDVGSWYYQLLIGGSIVYNLVFMLITFLASEGVKNYKLSYSMLLVAAGAGQIVRIYILPQQAVQASVVIKSVSYPVMGAAQAGWVIGCLVLSAVCCLVAGAVGAYRSGRITAYDTEKTKGMPAAIAAGKDKVMLLCSVLLLVVGVALIFVTFRVIHPIFNKLYITIPALIVAAGCLGMGTVGIYRSGLMNAYSILNGGKAA